MGQIWNLRYSASFKNDGFNGKKMPAPKILDNVVLAVSTTLESRPKQSVPSYHKLLLSY